MRKIRKVKCFQRAYKFEKQIQIKFCRYPFAWKEIFFVVKDRRWNLFLGRVNDSRLSKADLKCLGRADIEVPTATTSQAL